MSCGIILLDKEAGCSSAQAIAAVKRRLKLKKIGHAGTLDPMATGLLVCLCGGATRLADYALKGRKTYTGEILLGLETDSNDITGKETARVGAVPRWADIENAAMGFVGFIDQLPPRVSAIKVGGERAYRVVREGGEPELSPRRVELVGLEVSPLCADRISFRLVCSKGFYVRSLARDLGDKLGCGATLAVLRREGSEPFCVQDAGKIDDIGLRDIRSVECLFPASSRLELDHASAELLLRGDTKVLYSLSAELERLDAGSEVLYFDRQSGRACGLLLREERGWRFGVNIPDGD